MEEVLIAKIEKVVAEFCRGANCPESAVGNGAMSRGNWVRIIREREMGLSLRAHDKLFDWLAANWPKNHPVPAEIWSWMRFRRYDVVLDEHAPSPSRSQSKAFFIKGSPVA